MNRSSWIAVAVVFGACGGGSRPSVDVNADNLCAEAAEVICYDMYTCCTEGEIEQTLGVQDPRNQDQCRDDLQRGCERELAGLQWSLDMGRVTLDTQIMDGCLEALIAPDGSCAEVASVAPWAEACTGEALVGAVAAGGECFYDYECAGDGSFCADDRTCTALPGNGDPCGNSGCAPDFYCEFPDCAPRLGVNDPCGSTTECEVGLFCDLDAANPTCKDKRAAGQSCAGYDQCVTGSTCNQGGECANGNGCFTDDDCYGVCEDDLSTCLTDSNCATGTCSVTTTTFCNSDGNCPITETCNFPVQCLPGTCTGDSLCAENFTVYDYCDDARNGLPI